MKKFTMEIPVHFSDSDSTGHMSPVSVMRAMIESSMRHSDSVRTEDFRHIWVLYQWDVDFHSFPLPGRVLRAETWTTGFYKFYAYRNFALYDGDKPVAEAKTTWLLLSGDSKRPIRVPPVFADQYGSGILSEPVPDEKEAAEFEEVHRETIRVRSYDIDGNQHVNNLVYANWILETVPVSYRGAHTLKKLILTYRRQIFYPESVLALSTREDHVIHHRIMDEEDEVRAWARTEWA